MEEWRKRIPLILVLTHSRCFESITNADSFERG